jgi:chaperonin cofactor prefoldin
MSRYTEALEETIDKLHVRCDRIENENIALATANSKLRSELRQLQAAYGSVTHG